MYESTAEHAKRIIRQVGEVSIGKSVGVHLSREAFNICCVSTLLLPRTAGCLVCGRDNPHGLHLRLRVDAESGIVRVDLEPDPKHVGFTNVIHGGLIATVADEAMVWAATWANRRFCLCAEMTVRFRRPASPGMKLTFEASVETSRSRLITTTYRCLDQDGQELSSGSGKYIPVSEAQHAEVIKTFIEEPASLEAARILANKKD